MQALSQPWTTSSSRAQAETPDSPPSQPGILAPYRLHRNGRISSDSEEAIDKSTFLWEDHAGKRTHTLEIWPNPEHPSDALPWVTSEVDVVDVEAEVETAEKKEQTTEDNLDAASSPGPLRLYDCENMVLKSRQVYLKETMGAVPSYVIVSQVWGVIRDFMRVPTVPWLVPISNRKKWDVIQDFCKGQHVKWLWLDVICINQSRTPEAEMEKGKEVPKMNQYYREASTCLVIPHNYRIFSSAHARIMEVLSSFADSGASVKDNAKPIWDSIDMLAKVADDAWFWRVWTYQELLLPKKHVLLDGQELCLDRLGRCLSWYYAITSSGILERPQGGNVYEFIDLGGFGFKGKPWANLIRSWKLKPVLKKNGYIDLLPAINITVKRQCTFPADRILGIYGLLKEDDRLPLDGPQATGNTEPEFLTTEGDISESSDGVLLVSNHHSAHISPPRRLARLERLWEQTLVKTMEEGRVWPLLYDGMVVDAPRGTNWMPRIINSLAADKDIYDVYDHRNRKRVMVTKAGVQLTVRVVGRISGVSVRIGDGTGELDKMISCTWALVAQGFNPQPIFNMFKDALARLPQLEGTIEDDQTQLHEALHAPSVAECFKIVNRMDLTDRLFRAGGIAGWHRAVFAAQPGPSYSGTDGTYVFLGWICPEKVVDSRQCWVLDVTAGSQDVKRWVIANKTGPNTFHKIGTVVSNTLPVFTENNMCALIVLD